MSLEGTGNGFRPTAAVKGKADFIISNRAVPCSGSGQVVEFTDTHAFTQVHNKVLRCFLRITLWIPGRVVHGGHITVEGLFNSGAGWNAGVSVNTELALVKSLGGCDTAAAGLPYTLNSAIDMKSPTPFSAFTLRNFADVAGTCTNCTVSMRANVPEEICCQIRPSLDTDTV